MGVKNNNIIIQPPLTNCGIGCENILRSLPDWFGIEDSLVQYVKDANTMPTMFAKDDGLKILQVKTVSADRDCSAYAKTRAFYKAVGFIPLEVFPTFWDKANPCLVLVKQI